MNFAVINSTELTSAKRFDAAYRIAKHQHAAAITKLMTLQPQTLNRLYILSPEDRKLRQLLGGSYVTSKSQLAKLTMINKALYVAATAAHDTLIKQEREARQRADKLKKRLQRTVKLRTKAGLV